MVSDIVIEISCICLIENEEKTGTEANKKTIDNMTRNILSLIVDFKVKNIIFFIIAFLIIFINKN
jgi:hypothetical protein